MIFPMEWYYFQMCLYNCYYVVVWCPYVIVRFLDVFCTMHCFLMCVYNCLMLLVDDFLMLCYGLFMLFWLCMICCVWCSYVLEFVYVFVYGFLLRVYDCLLVLYDYLMLLYDFLKCVYDILMMSLILTVCVWLSCMSFLCYCAILEFVLFALLSLCVYMMSWSSCTISLCCRTIAWWYCTCFLACVWLPYVMVWFQYAIVRYYSVNLEFRCFCMILVCSSIAYVIVRLPGVCLYDF